MEHYNRQNENAKHATFFLCVFKSGQIQTTALSGHYAKLTF